MLGQVFIDLECESMNEWGRKRGWSENGLRTIMFTFNTGDPGGLDHCIFP